MQSTKITVKRPEQLAGLPLLAPRSSSPVSLPSGLARLPQPGFPKDPKLKVLQVCPVAGHSKAWMEVHLLQLPQRLLLWGAAALTASALELSLIHI